MFTDIICSWRKYQTTFYFCSALVSPTWHFLSTLSSTLCSFSGWGLRIRPVDLKWTGILAWLGVSVGVVVRTQAKWWQEKWLAGGKRLAPVLEQVGLGSRGYEECIDLIVPETEWNKQVLLIRRQPKSTPLMPPLKKTLLSLKAAALCWLGYSVREVALCRLPWHFIFG